MVVLIPFGPEFLAMELAELAQARDRARGLLGAGAPAERGAQTATRAPERLLTAEEIAEATGIPAPWYLAQARRGEIPHVRLGKYVRFKLSEVIEHGAVKQRSKDTLSLVRGGLRP